MFLLEAKEESFVIILMFMVGKMLVSACKHKRIEKKSTMMLNLVLHAVLFAWSVKITVMGIVEIRNFLRFLVYGGNWQTDICKLENFRNG